MDKTQTNQSGLKASSRSNRVSTSPSRPITQHKQNASHQRRGNASAASSSTSPAKGASNGHKKTSGGRLYLDSDHGPLDDYHPANSPKLDYAYDWEDYTAIPASPTQLREVSESSGVEEPLAASIPAPALRGSTNGNKKVVKSANHLLNFSYAPRERPTASSYRRPQLSIAPYRRERFVQSNFRFIVSKNGEYADNLIDADAVIDWELVEIVVCPLVEEEVTCSICLEQPTCPRIAKCGHVFCWSCILQLFSYHEQTSLAPCPVCLREKIRIVDLRAVIMEKCAPSRVGDLPSFTLLQRPKHLNIVYPATMDPVLDSKKPLPYYDHEASARFNRLTVTNQLLDLFLVESAALESAIVSAKSSQDLTLYMEVAQQMLKDEIAQIETKETSRSSGSIPSLHSSSSSNLASSGLLSPLQKPAPKQRLSELMPEQLEASNCFFFYQASDGQQIFLHPLCSTYLVEEFGADALMPVALTEMKVLDLETKTFDEKARRKYPSLSHLPISCQYQFAVLDISGMISDPVKRADFLSEVRKRQEWQERNSAREARRAEIQAQILAAKQLEQQQKLYEARRAYSSMAAVDAYGPSVVAPDLDDLSFPEINAVRISSAHTAAPQHVYALSSPSTPTLPTGATDHANSTIPRSSSAWDKGTLITSLQRAPEEAFPALPSFKDKHGNMVLSDESLKVYSPISAPVSTTTTAWGTPSPTPNAWASSAPTTTPGNAKNGTSTPQKKKVGKKTILLI